MIDTIEYMRKLVNDNLVMGLRFQMNRELNKLESEIEQELNSRSERIKALESLVQEMDRDCRGCKYSCYTEKGCCGIITRINELQVF